ncbi:MAG: hypothetical protein AB1451_15045 [Nitrospirota bacterium]
MSEAGLTAQPVICDIYPLVTGMGGQLKGNGHGLGGALHVSVRGPKLQGHGVMAVARDAGLVATKVVGLSETHTALKLVIPKAKR